MNTLLSDINTQQWIDVIWNEAVEWTPKVILAVITFAIGWKLSGVVGRILGKALDKKGIDSTLKPFLVSLTTALLKVGVVLCAISTAGIQTTPFAAIFAAMGLAIGMALSGNLQNFASGVILLSTRPFKIGDVIEAQGFVGKVHEIQIFQTIMLTGDNKMIYIPNGKLQSDSMINYSTMPDRRVDFSFGIGYNDNIDKAREVILSVISGIEQIYDTPEPLIKVGQLADSSVNLTTRVWCKSADYWDVHFAMNERVKKALDEAGISIPFPQRDLHIYNEKVS
ncbi:small-conductance mechanosensitive channel [Rubritalea halochordaticola]|uniref:Small-conductance mechanosensitive channel n=1 Tax=Rubritalea halochordaticola TaxID=714537 RepID=A0ABP9V6B1_9BACT